MNYTRVCALSLVRDLDQEESSAHNPNDTGSSGPREGDNEYDGSWIGPGTSAAIGQHGSGVGKEPNVVARVPPIAYSDWATLGEGDTA
ncbi:MAG: hypothetical protein ACRDXF_05735 [Acidimicrobiia bacterium]